MCVLVSPLEIADTAVQLITWCAALPRLRLGSHKPMSLSDHATAPQILRTQPPPYLALSAPKSYSSEARQRRTNRSGAALFGNRSPSWTIRSSSSERVPPLAAKSPLAAFVPLACGLCRRPRVAATVSLSIVFPSEMRDSCSNLSRSSAAFSSSSKRVYRAMFSLRISASERCVASTWVRMSALVASASM